MELYDVLDQIDQVVYLSDLDTHEIIFVNRYGKKQYGPVTPGVSAMSIFRALTPHAPSAPTSACGRTRITAIPGTASCLRAICCSTTASSR